MDTDSVTGKWTNDLGSTVKFILTPKTDTFGETQSARNLFGDSGDINGYYQTKVVSNSGSNEIPKQTALFGTYRKVEDGYLLTFNVQWIVVKKDGKTTYSTTTWIGKYFSSLNHFTAKWYLLSDTSKEDEWSNTRIGSDRFAKDV